MLGNPLLELFPSITPCTTGESTLIANLDPNRLWLPGVGTGRFATDRINGRKCGGISASLGLAPLGLFGGV